MAKKKINWGFIYSRLIKYADPATRNKPGLTMAEKAVADAIADHTGQNKTAWPGYGTIAHLAGCDRSTAIRTVKRLIDRGILRRVTSSRDSNNYAIDAHVLAALISKERYRQRAENLLRRLSQGAGKEQKVNERTSSTVPPPPSQDATTIVAGRHHHSGRTPPELSKERPHPTRSKNTPPAPAEREAGRGNLRLGGGGLDSPFNDESQISGYINHPEISEVVATAEAMLLPLKLATSKRPVASVAASTVSLFKEIEQVEGRLPTGVEIASALSDSAFSGLRGLSFGLLTAPAKRETFRRVLVERIRRSKLASSLAASNDSARHEQRLEEAKRESMLPPPAQATYQGGWTDVPPPKREINPAAEEIFSHLDD